MPDNPSVQLTEHRERSLRTFKREKGRTFEWHCIQDAIAAGETDTTEGLVKTLFARRHNGLVRAMGLITSESTSAAYKRVAGMLRGLKAAIEQKLGKEEVKLYLAYLFTTKTGRQYAIVRAAERKASEAYKRQQRKHRAQDRAIQRAEKGLDDRMVKEALGRRRKITMEALIQLFPPVDPSVSSLSYRTSLGACLARLGWIKRRFTDGSYFYSHW